MSVNSVSIPLSERFGYVRVVQFSYAWTINYFQLLSYPRLAGESLTSPTFWPGSNNELKWHIKLYPYGINHYSANNVSLYLCLVSSKKNDDVRAKFKFSILDEKGIHKNVKEISNTHTFVAGTSSAMCGFDDFSRENFFVNHYNLTIVCEIKAVLNISDVKGKNDGVPFTMPKCRLFDNLKSLFESKKFSDVMLIVRGQAFQAHKAILAMRSPVFSAMFEHEMAEQLHNEVEISDIRPEVFNEMLRFMYTGEVTDIERIADLLLVAADKYALERLKLMCEEVLRKNITVHNAAYMLILADTYVANQLKPEAVKFIVTRTIDVMSTVGFKLMVELHPHLVAELLHALAIRKNDEPQELMLFAIGEGTL